MEKAPDVIPAAPPPSANGPGTRQDRLLALMKAHEKDENAVRWSQLAGWKESPTRNALAGLMAKGLVKCPVKGRYRA